MNRPLQKRPDPLPLSERLLSDLVRAPLFFVATAAFGSASLAASCFDKDGSLQHRIAQWWAAASTRVSGSKVMILNAERLRGIGPAVIASNHLSYMDTPVVFSGLPFQFRIVARQGLWKIPFIGWHLRRSGQIPVNVANPRASVASLGRGVKTLQSGMSVFIFPEGGRSTDGLPRPFMNGPAFMAIRARVPLVPIALVGTFELLPMHAKRFHPVPLLMVVGEPIDASKYTLREVDLLTRQLADAVEELYYAHGYRTRPVTEEANEMLVAENQA